MSFENLEWLRISGSLVPGSAKGQQQLQFMLPRLPFSCLRRAWLVLGLQKVLSPICIAIIADDVTVFEKIAEVHGDREVALGWEVESIVNTGEGAHYYTIQVTMDVSQLQSVFVLLAMHGQKHKEEVRNWKEALKKVENIYRFNRKDMNWYEGLLMLKGFSFGQMLKEHLGGMRSLRELHLDGTIIDKIPDAIGQLTNLCEIHMTWCQRLSVLSDSVCQLSNLEVLDLQGCMKLSSVPERLGEMKFLKKLDLSRTCIETIPNSIGQLINLHRLSVQHLECLRELPNSICQLCSLQYLNLQGCTDLWSLPERLGDMDKLKYLILDNTRMQALPDSVGRLKNLQLLSLEGCKLLKALPNSIGRLSSLRELKISGTSLRGCENDISHLATINELTFSSFELLGLCKKLCKALKHLHSIDVVIKELPDFVGEMENLEELLLECEMLRALPNWISLCFKKLTRLEIRSKNLKALPDCIGSLKQLERLTLKCENLDALPNSIGSLEQMQQLELNCANLEALPDSIGELGNIYGFKIESASLKALPNSIASLGRIHYLHLRCMSLDSIPDYVGGLKELYCFEVMSNSLKALPQSIGSLKSIRTLILNCPNLEILYDSIGELKGLSHFEVDSQVLEYLPHSIGSITGIQSLSLRCVNLDALPDSMETLESLDFLELHCDNFTAPPDFIGRLENLESFSFKSKNLKYLHATIDESLGRLNTLSLSGCENLEVLVAASIQQTGLSRLSCLESLHLDNCKRLQCIPQLPSSLLLLDASGCTNLTTISDVSDLKSLENLNLGGCKLLEDVCGLENISSNLKTLEMPGPCDFMECCHLIHEFRNIVFKEIGCYGGVEELV
ncbi:Leucine-rich repeat soc-2-like protein [Nymphaea thermarum]|nr:Leucine-rich repeat soc-2-like protein [Nymphaea thermarum]